MFEVLDKLREVLCDGDTTCNDACSTMMLGCLIKQMHKNGLDEERPKPPFLGYSMDDVQKILSDFESVKWSDPHSYNLHPCNLKSRIEPQVDQIVEKVKGIRLSDWSEETRDIPFKYH